PPIDPKSDAPENQTEATKRFKADKDLQQVLSETKKLSEVSAADFDAVFYPGGHGPLWDLATDPDSIRLIEDFWRSKKPVAAVCHAPSVLLNVKDENGKPLVQGRKVTGFTNSEEEAVQLTQVVPFLLEDELRNKGGEYSKKEDWAVHVVQDGLLITGQNPASSEEAADRLMALIDN
ncbi:MAG TPA: type 1 glutamine amidotransferase domain-containing protein, partial [Sphingobacteriaceae bacterium]